MVGDNMPISARAFVLSTVWIATLLPTAVIRGQEPTASSTDAPTGAIAPSAARHADVRGAQGASAKPAPAPDFFHQDTLTGDWNGTRTTWTNKGLDFASSLTQFYQGVSSGGTGTSTSCTQIIGDTVNFTGNSNVANNCSSYKTRPFGPIVTRVAS